MRKEGLLRVLKAVGAGEWRHGQGVRHTTFIPQAPFNKGQSREQQLR